LGILRTVALLSAAAVLGNAHTARAQGISNDLNGYLTFGSGYWSRGVSRNDGPTLQAGIDWQMQNGVFVGGWAANVDYAADYDESAPRAIETDVYVGYHSRGTTWSWTTTLGRYGYPHAGYSYDYNELSATVGYRDRVFYTASFGDDFYGWGRRSLNQEVALAVPLHGDFEIGMTVGRFAIDGTRVDYSHWNVGVSKLVRRVAIDLRYYGTGLDRVGYLGDPTAERYVLSISYGLRGKRGRI
jgi:uncharacterized protein (TIGR02001 family)